MVFRGLECSVSVLQGGVADNVDTTTVLVRDWLLTVGDVVMSVGMCVSVCVCVRENVCVCVCVCMFVRETQRERKCVCV